MDLETLNIKHLDPEQLLSRIYGFLSNYITELYEYNNKIKKYGFYFKPVHIVVKKNSSGEKIKYYYFGRYWYKIVPAKKKNRRTIRWIYLGKNKPIRNLIDPPKNPLEGLVIKISNDGIEIISSNKDILENIKKLITQP